jgi:hypothetical protein
VVGECANPECDVPFRYFRDGKLFRFDPSVPFTPIGIQPDGAARRRIENFWLCGSCASKMTLTSEDGVGVTTRPLRHSMGSVTVSIGESQILQAGD